MIILRDPGTGDQSGGGNTFITTLPEEFRKEPSLQSFKDVASLAKSYVEAQKLIGAKRIALPGEKASDVEWEAFYNQIGRPDTFDKYEVPDVKMEEGLAPDAKKLEAVKQHFHKLGLTTKQARGVMEYYMNSVNEGAKGSKAASEAQAQAQIQALRQEWGDKFDVNVDIARSVIKKFGGENHEEVLKFLDSSGLGNNAQLVKLMHSIGASVMEDSARRGGGGSGLPLNDASRAAQEIEVLKTDADFQKALGDARHVGHRAAVDRWTNLHKAAYQG